MFRPLEDDIIIKERDKAGYITGRRIVLSLQRNGCWRWFICNDLILYTGTADSRDSAHSQAVSTLKKERL